MEQIIKNLSPLVGAKPNDIRWAPTTGYQICKELRIASLICLDIDSDRFSENGIQYEFSNRISIQTAKIYDLSRRLSPVVLNTNYILGIQNSISTSLHDILFLYSLSKKINDSAIYDVIASNAKLSRMKWKRYVLFILLDSFALRWALYEHFILEKPFVYGELGNERLERLIKNIYYVKAKLEEYDSDLVVDLNHHLSTLLLNVLAIQYELKKKYIEVERR